ncbi:MAG TPA: zinc-binding alcohol dehydrogenase family protein [Gemmataceae bacterium]|jgi:2-desacetyl-2-hydroxyethyl bacteriochlorophyllide A dehydrogenase
MRQVTLLEPGRFVAEDRPPTEPPPGHALVRTRRVGVCGTDLHAFAGRQPFFSYPRILGHELGVEVLSLPPGDHGLQPGDRCAVEPYLWCGACHACRTGKPNCCERLQVLGVHTDGGMRGRFAVPVEKLHRSDKLTFEQLALVETLGIGFHAVERGHVEPGETVLVVGAGPIGLAVTEFAKAAGGRVRVLDLNPQRRQFVADGWGVETLAEADGKLAEVVFDATGSARAMEASFDRVAHGGRLVFVGIVLDRIGFADPLFHRREMTVLASRNSAGAFPEIIRRIEAGAIDTTPWVTHRLGLTEVPEQFAELPRTPGLVKAMVEVGDADA